MNRAGLISIIDNGEGTKVDFKLRPPSRIKLARLIVAFANTRGGYIIVGVDDSSKVVGVDSIEQTNSDIKDAVAIIRPEPATSMSCLKIEGRDVVICHVKRSDNKPLKVISDNGRESVYIRVGSSIYPVSKTDEGRLRDEDALRKAIRFEVEHESLLETIRKSGAMTATHLAKRHNLSHRRVSKLLVTLVRAGIIVEMDGGRYGLR